MSDVKITISADASDLQREVGSAKSALSGLGDVAKFAIGGIVANVAMSAASALAGIGSSAVKAAAEFERSMNMLGAVTGATTEQLEQMRQKALELGDDVTLPGVSAQTAADAMRELAKAGLSVEQAIAAAKGTLQLAAAGQVEAAYAAEVVAGAMNAFRLSGDRATEVADLLAAAANASAADVTDMAYALQMASSVAALSNQSIQDVITGIALLANAGIKGSDAGTSLKTMFMRLISPTKEARKTINELGVSVFDAEGKMRPLPDLVQQFSTALGKLTEEQRGKVLSEVFGSDAIRAATIVLSAGTDAYTAMNKAVTEQGAASKLAESQMKGLSGAIEGVNSAIETLAIRAATPLLEPLTRAVAAFGEIISSQEFIGAIEGFAMFLGEKLSEALSFVSSFVQNSAGFISSFSDNFMRVVGEVSGFIGSLVGTIGNLIQQAQSYIGDLVRSTSSARSTFTSAFQQIAGIVTWAINNVIAPVFQSFVRDLLPPLLNWFRENMPLIARFFSEAFNLIANILKTVLPPALEYARDVMTTFVSVIRGLLLALLNVFKLIMAILLGDWDAAWRALQDIVNNAIGAIISFLTGAVNALFNLGKRIGEALLNGLRSVFGGGGGTAQQGMPPGFTVQFANPALSAVTSSLPPGFTLEFANPSGQSVYNMTTTNNYVLNVQTTQGMNYLSQDFRLMRRAQ